MKINELKDMCKVCGQTPCNCTHVVAEAASPAQQAGKKPKSEGVAEGLKEQVYKVVALDKSNALKKPTKLNVKASSIEDVFSRLAANDWYALSINGVEVVAGKRLKQGVAEVVHPDVTSKKYFIEPTENVRMGEFEFNARTFTGGLSDPNARGLQIRAYDPEQPKGQNLIGSTDFIVKSDKKGNQWLESDDTEVNDEYRGKGVAAMMYAFAKSLGNDIKSSPYQSQKGREMWRKWGTDAKHLAGKKGVAEGLDNTDDILQDLTSAYRTCVKHRDSYTNFGNIQTVYELLRDPLMKGDIAGYEKMHGYVAGKYPDAFDALMDEVSGEQGVAEGIFGSKENSAVPLVNKIAQVARQLTPQNVNVGKQIIQSNADDILRMMSPQAKTGIEVIEQGVAEARESCPECGGPMFPALILGEKQDACYYKVKSRYKVWPSAYASGALVQCRKKGAANWGNKSK